MSDEFYKVFSQRWIFLIIVSFISFCQMYSISGLVNLNDAVTQFYRTSSYKVDLLSTVGIFMEFPVSVLTAYFSSKMTLRFVMLTTLTMVTAGSVICTVGFLSRELFYVTAFGRLVMTSSFGLMFTTQVLLSNNWFPSHETATAFTIPIFCMRMATIAGSQVYTHIAPSYNETSTNLIGDEVGPEGIKLLFTVTYGIFSVISIICLILGIVYVKNNPPSPPSRSQMKILEEKLLEEGSESHATRLRSFWEIISGKQFVLLTTSACLGVTALSITIFMLPSLVLSTFPQLDNRAPGRIILFSTISGAIVMMISARALDRFKAFKTITIAGTGFATICCFSLYFAHKYQYFAAVFALYVLLQTSRMVYFPAVLELLVEITYPQNKGQVILLSTAITSVFTFLWATMIRMILTSYGATMAMLACGGVQSLATLMTCFVRPVYKRQLANENKPLLESVN